MDLQKAFRNRVDSGVVLLDEEDPIARAPDEVTELAEKLKYDRLIKIFVGDAAQPYLIPQSTLESASRYFTEAINRDRDLDGSPADLTFPEDDQEVWKILLFWFVKGKMPESMSEGFGECHVHAMQILMVKCWVSGCKYCMSDFQDSALLHLIYWLDVSKVPFHLETHAKSDPFPWTVMRLAFQSSTQGSALRRVFATAALDYNSRMVDGLYSPNDMNDLQLCLEGISGAMQDMVEASAKDARKQSGFETRSRYRIMGGTSVRALFEDITSGQVSPRSNSDQVLVNLQAALNLRIQTAVEESKTSRAIPVLLSRVAEKGTESGGAGGTRCDQM